MPFKKGSAKTKTSFKLGHIRSRDSIKKQSETIKEKIGSGRIDMSESIKRMNTPEANLKKGHKGINHPMWIKDRSMVKQKRLCTEEKWFFKEILRERGYKCELTGNIGQLSVHHIKPVWKYPEERYNKNNCIVILKRIHKRFHLLYGFKSDELDWCEFILKKEYESL